MFWNHRVVRKTEAGETLYMFAEVYYDDSTKLPFSYGEPFYHGDTMDELKELTDRLIKALDKPVLDDATDFHEPTEE